MDNGGSATSSNTTSPDEIEQVLGRYQGLLQAGLYAMVQRASRTIPREEAVAGLLDDYYGQIEYHLGWRQPDLTLVAHQPGVSGKLLRPTLVLLACDFASCQIGLGDAERALLRKRIIPAAVCIELVHNFSLIHDDIEDSDEERRHRPTLWKLWGVPQAINTGDGVFSVARMGLWQLADAGIEPQVIVHLARLLDHTCMELCEGQFLDMRYEGRRDITVPMYLDMIGRKTAALMSCATAFGARLGAPHDAAIQQRLARFGRALGVAFQLRDDLLGLWEAKQLGKTAAGDLRRKKMSLPVIHALETASTADHATLDRIYAGTGPTSEAEIAEALAILNRTEARVHVRAALQELGILARAALMEGTDDQIQQDESYRALATLLDFVLAAE